MSIIFPFLSESSFFWKNSNTISKLYSIRKTNRNEFASDRSPGVFFFILHHIFAFLNNLGLWLVFSAIEHLSATAARPDGWFVEGVRERVTYAE